MSADNPRQRPFKVWSADRTLRKGIIASSLADLVRKGKIKLDIHEAEGVVVVLEADGTEVDDDYFRRIEENTIVLLLKAGERWYPPGVEAIRAAIHAIPRIVCDAINTLELIDEAPSWKIMDNRGRVTVVLHWDQRDIRRLQTATGRSPGSGKDSDGIPVIEEPSGVDGQDRRSPILITARVEGVQMADGSRRGVEKVTTVPIVKRVTTINDVQPRVSSPDLTAVCDFHCCALHEEGGRIHVNKSVATSPIQEQPEVRRPSPKGAHVRFLDVHVEPKERESSESDTENTANEDEQLSERYLLLVDQLSVEQKRHLTIKDIGIILERLSSKIVDVERLEREKESEDVHNWTIKATIKGEVLREIGVVYNGHYYVPPVARHDNDVTDSTTGDLEKTQVARLLSSLRQNLGAIFLLSVEELELLADMKVQEQRIEREGDLDFIIRLRDTCDRILSERREATEAMNLLQVLKQSSEDSFPHKRTRGNTDECMPP